MREIVIDSFAGGGGTSEGIKAATGRDPDIAVNHDQFALAMHRINHPGTHHLVEDVTEIDSVGMCAGRPVGMLWMSPDCKDHSKAKGGKPRDKNIRGLAWSCFGWVKKLPKWQRPRVVFLENVEEFQDWAPLTAEGKRCPVQKGSIFKEFVKAWQALGYVVEWRERRAWWSGAATIRKRLYMVMRCDGEPIVWPERMYGNPNDAGDAALIAAGQLKPWRTAADIIDFSLPCPSIFDTSAEIKAKLGIRAIRPLADNTMARVAKGTMRYVVNSAKPFVVKVNHTGRPDARDRDIDAPLGTVTGKRDDALVTPFVTYAQQGGGLRDAAEPLQTITASAKDQNAIVTPFITKFVTGSTGHAIDEPVHTITAHASDTHGGGAAPMGIVAPYLVPRYGERPGQEPRTRSVEEPAPVIVPTGNEGSLAAVHLSRQFGASVGSDATDPVGTITAGGAGKAAVVAAFLAQHNNDRGIEPNVGRSLDQPMATQTTTPQQALVAAHMLNLRGSDRRDASAEEPVRTASAGGNHAATVYAFLAKYFGTGLPSQPCDEPLHTVSTKPRHGLVTVTVAGVLYAIVDIGMRMLTPRERFNAQGFAYWDCKLVLDQWLPHDLHGKPITATSADLVSSAKPTAGRSDAAPLDVLIDLGRSVLQLHNAGRSASDASDAALNVEFPLPTEIASIARTLARESISGANSTPIGVVGSLTSVEPSTPATSGARFACSSGAGTTLGADAAQPDGNIAGGATRCTILPGGLVSPTAASTLSTLFSYVVNATASFIPSGTPTAPSSAIRLTVQHHYIIDRGIMEDGTEIRFTLEQQGYMCGNSVCPSEAHALVAANYQARERAGPKLPAPMSLFLEAAE